MRAVNLSLLALPTEKETRASSLAWKPTGGPVPSIVKLLDVEKSARYQPTKTQTFCNVYAHDVCHLAGVYLPRVWWSMPEAVTDTTAVVYGKTIHEMNANALYDWLIKYGVEFGWKRLGDIQESQQAADSGHVVVIAAARTDRAKSGHIVIVHPQTDTCLSLMKGGEYTPVQSQAGRTNYCVSTAPGRWWEHPNFGGQFWFWVNKAVPAVKS